MKLKRRKNNLAPISTKSETEPTSKDRIYQKTQMPNQAKTEKPVGPMQMMKKPLK
jgi:hypothetical protein